MSRGRRPSNYGMNGAHLDFTRSLIFSNLLQVHDRIVEALAAYYEVVDVVGRLRKAVEGGRGGKGGGRVDDNGGR